MEEIYRSFETLKLIEDNPSVLVKLTEMSSELSKNLDDNAKERHRRQVETTTPSGQSGSNHADDASNNGQVASQTFLGPYSYPMFSGIVYVRVIYVSWSHYLVSW